MGSPRKPRLIMPRLVSVSLAPEFDPPAAAVKATAAVTGRSWGGAAPYPNLKSAETRLDKLTWLSVIESVALSLIMTFDSTCDIALVSAA